MSGVRWGIIGCGDVCEQKSGPALQGAAGSELVAVMRRTPGAAEDFAKRHGVPLWFEDAESLACAPEVTAIYIASPPGAHMEHALVAVKAGKPTYIEKPLGRNATESEAIAKLFDDAGVPMFVAYYRRALPPFVQAKALLASGELGKPTFVSFVQTSPAAKAVDGEVPWRLSAANSGGGLFLDTGVHVIDLIEHLLGEPLVDIAGSAANIGSPWLDVEDTISMTFGFAESGTRGSGSWNFAGVERSEALVISCTGGRLTLVSSAMTATVQRLEHGVLSDPEPLGGGPISALAVQQGLVQTIVDELAGGAESPSKAANAIRCARVVDIVLDGYYGGRSDAFWERDVGTWPGNVAMRARA
jgi:predicted dehydrogenase